MRSHHRLATAALTAALLAAGCSGGDEAGGDAAASATSGPTASSSQQSDAAGGTAPSGDPSGSGTGSSPGSSAPSIGPAAPPTPSGAVTTGALAAGFPTDVVPLLPGSTITVSTVTPAEGFRTISLSGTTSQPAEEVLAFYRTSLVGQGFVETAGAQVPGFPSATFSRASGADLLVIAVSTLDGVQTFTLGGALAG